MHLRCTYRQNVNIYLLENKTHTHKRKLSLSLLRHKKRATHKTPTFRSRANEKNAIMTPSQAMHSFGVSNANAPLNRHKTAAKVGKRTLPLRRAASGDNDNNNASKNDDTDEDIQNANIPLWAQNQKINSPALTNISFALVNPQGPMNVGSCARVMQNFGIYDLKIVQGSSFVFRGSEDEETQYEKKDEASETEGTAPDLNATLTKDAKKTMSSEAYRFACAADWMLQRASDEEWYPDVKAATADRSVVFATTARNRDGSQPMLDSREACRIAAKLALDGEKVSFLFGNERVGLTNEELRTAQYLVAIPTAGVGEVCGKSLKYTGSSGPTSLNLSHAVGVLAYEAFVETTLEEDRRKNGNGSSTSSGSSSNNNNNNNSSDSEENTASLRKQTNAGKTETDKLMSSGEKQQLTQALFSARRSLDVCPSTATNDDGTEDEESTDLQSREFKAIERVLSNPNLRGRDAAVLFQVARRILAVMENNDESPLEKVIVDELRKVKKSDAPIKEARNALRDKFNISLTNREILEAQKKTRAGDE
jgi:tRNA C32,U32 (ribose-2'-O)-methylase TrmJ